MAITDWKYAAAAATLVAGKRGVHEWTAPYILTSDNPRDDALTCVEFMGSIGRGIYSVFKYGDTTDTSVVCNSIAPVRMQNSLEYWLVTLTYGPPVPIVDEDKVDDFGRPSEDPADWRLDVQTASSVFQVPVEKAWNIDQMPKDGTSPGYVRPAGTLGPVINSAGVPYDPPLMREVTEMILRVSGWQASCNLAVLRAFNHTTNISPMRLGIRLRSRYAMDDLIVEAYTVKLNSISGAYVGDADWRAWKLSLEYAIRTRASDGNPQDGFLDTILDRGLSRLAMGGCPDGRGGIISASDLEDGMADTAPIRDLEGERTPEPVLLDGHGQPLSGSSTHSDPPVYFRWLKDPPADHRLLPMGIWE